MAVSDYLEIITSEHNQRPNFMAWVLALCQPFSDTQYQVSLLAFLLNVNQGVGDQLDVLGEVVGASRNLTAPLPPSDITTLIDPDYRTLLKAVIAQNYWDGTVPGMYAIWAQVFGSEFEVLVQDNQDMTMFVVVLASTFNTVELALLTNNYFNLRPAGVQMLGYYQPSAPGEPVFGCDIENGEIAGPDFGYFVEPLVV